MKICGNANQINIYILQIFKVIDRCLFIYLKTMFKLKVQKINKNKNPLWSTFLFAPHNKSAGMYESEWWHKVSILDKINVIHGIHSDLLQLQHHVSNDILS